MQLKHTEMIKLLERDKYLLISTLHKGRFRKMILVKHLSDNMWLISFNLLTGDFYKEVYRPESMFDLVFRFIDKWLKIFEDGDGTKH